jgi:DNA-binding SARP family transcriptional activator
MVVSEHDFHKADGVQTLRIQMLGAPEVLWGGEAVCISRRQVRALLFRLAARQEPVSRDQLCFLFWPDTPDAIARRCLTHLLTHLRLAVPIPHLILSSGEAVQLNKDRAWCDTVWLHELCRANRTALDIDLCWRALDLIRGPFLEGFSTPRCPEFELWVVREQQHWNCQILRLVSLLKSLHGAPPCEQGLPPDQTGDDSGQLMADGEYWVATAVLRRIESRANTALILRL